MSGNSSFYYPDDVTTPALADSFNQVKLLANSRTYLFDNMSRVGRLLDWTEDISSGRIYGPTGSDETADLPKFFSHKYNKTVVVITPSNNTARIARQAYIDQSDTDDMISIDNLYHIETDDAPIRPRSIVWMSSYTLISWLQSRRCRYDFPEIFQDMIVLIDQLQWQDYYIDTLDYMISPLRPYKFFSVSNNTRSGGARPRFSYRLNTFDCDQAPEVWNIHGTANPWSYDNLTSSTLVYVQNYTVTRRMTELYTSAGVEVYALDVDSPTDYIVGAVNSLRANNDRPVVIFADDSFRDGFLPNVKVVIDAGSYIDQSRAGEYGIDAIMADPHMFMQEWMNPLMEDIHTLPNKPDEVEPRVDSSAIFSDKLQDAYEPNFSPNQIWEKLEDYNHLQLLDIAESDSTPEVTTVQESHIGGQSTTVTTASGDMYTSQTETDTGDIGRDVIPPDEYDHLYYLAKLYHRLGIEMSATRRAYAHNLRAARYDAERPPELSRLPGLLKFMDVCSCLRRVVKLKLSRSKMRIGDFDIYRSVNMIDTRVKFYSGLLHGYYDPHIPSKYRRSSMFIPRYRRGENRYYNSDETYHIFGRRRLDTMYQFRLDRPRVP